MVLAGQAAWATDKRLGPAADQLTYLVVFAQLVSPIVSCLWTVLKGESFRTGLELPGPAAAQRTKPL